MPKLSSTLYLCLRSLALMITISKLLFAANSRTYPADLQVLKDLKNGVDPRSIAPGSCLSSWDFSLDPCDNIFSDHYTCGLRCDVIVSGFARVTEITLDPVGYSGSLTSPSWNLPYLQTLDISDNSFSGSIPDSSSNLTHLRRLCLSGNSLSGEVPVFLGSLSHLEELYLDNNHLHGPIPSSFNNLTSLKRLEIQQNRISGEFPNLGSLKNLYFFDASDNKLSGGIPATFPRSLVELSIRNNKLEGKIPDTIDSMRFLQVLDLSYNILSGSIPSVLFNHPSLEQLTLSFNNFSFLQVPGDKGLNSSLIAVDLSHNELQGFLPGFLTWMPKLAALSLEHNKFTGMIPAQYALKAVVPAGNTSSSFERLLLGGNFLFGPIPGPLLGLRPGSAEISLVDNCLYRCPDTFFFCRGGYQKSLVDCKRFVPTIP
ncbi:hypothetical protein PTKIN_Ptkin09bG0112800 [Pterospermum kingtungense]